MGIQKTPMRINLHCHVWVELVDQAGQSEQEEFNIVEAENADLKSGLLGEDTALGRLLMGRHAGDKLRYRVGDLKEVRILRVEAEEGSISSKAAEHRRKDVRKAVEQSEITNQMIFATASGSKWGDYEVDVEKLLKDEEPDDETP